MPLFYLKLRNAPEPVYDFVSVIPKLVNITKLIYSYIIYIFVKLFV